MACIWLAFDRWEEAPSTEWGGMGLALQERGIKGGSEEQAREEYWLEICLCVVSPS